MPRPGAWTAAAATVAAEVNIGEDAALVVQQTLDDGTALRFRAGG